MTQFSDLTQQVFDRALKSLEGRISPELWTALQKLVASGDITNARAISAAITKQIDTEATNAANK
jgi:hypothetical protein